MFPRALDFFFALVGIILLSPLLAAIALLVKVDSTGPIFHRAERVGWREKPFRLLKFRSMVVNAAQIGPGITTADDPRVTRVGKRLRRTKMDELPQLFNVLRGEMSLVGPRPEDPRYVTTYDSFQRRVFCVRPGITSAASLAFRHEQEMLQSPNWEKTYLLHVLPKKLAIDLDYLDRRTFWSDVRLILRTIFSMGK